MAGRASEGQNSVQSISRALALLELLSNSGRGASLAALCSASGLQKSTVHRLLASLKENGYVMQEGSGIYRLTFKVCQLSRRVIDGVSIVMVADPFLKALCEVSQETIHLAQREGPFTVYVHREENHGNTLRVSSTVGNRRPLHVSAAGKCILARLPDAEITDYWAHADKTRITETTIDSLDALMEQIALIRRRSYAIDEGENTVGVRCMSVAVVDHTGQFGTAISIAGARDRMTDDKMASLLPHLLKTRQDIMTAMGYVAD